MVVRYLDKSALGAGRSFHAVLAAGAAHQQASPSDADLSLERFLRDAEPPGHDDWVSTPALKETWKRGYAKALDSLRERIGAEIRQALSPRSSVGVRGPDRLAKRFPIGAHGRRAGDTSAFSFSGLRARSEDGTWRFEGGLRPRARDVAWAAEVRLSELGEDGKPLRLLEIAAASVRTLGVTARIADGALCLTVPAGIDEAHFEGQTVRVAGRILGEVVLDVAGSVATDQGHV